MQINIGKGIEMAVDTAKLNEAVMAHVVAIGLRNILMDSHAPVTQEKVGPDGDVVEQSRAVAEKKLAAMYAGEIRTARTAERDPVRAEAMRLAIKAVNAAVKKAGKEVDAKTVREKAATIMDKFMAQAIQAVNALKALEVDVGDLPEVKAE